MSTPSLRSVEFRRERESGWRQLARLVTQIERSGPRGLTPSELTELPMLYRSALSSLSVARAISLDRNLLEFLDNLCARAWCCIHSPRRPVGSALAEFLRHLFPAAVRSMHRHVALAAIFLGLGMLAGYLLTTQDISRFHAFVDPQYSQGRGPGASTESLRDALYGTGSAANLGAFSAMLFTHNAGVGLLCFAVGIAAGLPVLYLLLTNGLLLGAFAALYASRGLSTEFWAWILPHGIPELTAIVLCGAAGLRIADGLIFPGPHRRAVTLAEAGRQAALVAMGALAMLLAAGLIEGFFRQAVHSVPLRYALALLSAVAVPAWLLSGAGSRRRP